MCLCKFVYVCMHIYVCMNVYDCVRVSVSVCVCMCMCMSERRPEKFARVLFSMHTLL